MNDAINQMLGRYTLSRPEDYIQATHEILQELALLGLWRAKFFEHAAFYGGTALRLLYGLERFSEDLDFSLLKPRKDFDFSPYLASMDEEIRSFGFKVKTEIKEKEIETPIKSAFLKADTRLLLIEIQTSPGIVHNVPKNQTLKIRLELDVDPPSGFSTENKYLLQPIPFPIRTYLLSDLFAGKMHAILCRKWKLRVKGRDWYDLLWYVSRGTELNLGHLESRMRQTGHWIKKQRMDKDAFQKFYINVVKELDIQNVKKDIEPFLHDCNQLDGWSQDLFISLADRIKIQE